MKINCIIIENDLSDKELLEEYIEETQSLKLLGSFKNPIDTMPLLTTKTVDLIFSDIEMPGMDGISFIKSLKKPPLVIFTTAHMKFAFDGFELNAIDFLLKPFSFERFLRSVNKVQKIIRVNEENSKPEEYLITKDRNKVMVIPFEEIYYIQGMKDYVKIVTKEKTIISMQRMKEMERLLPFNKFIRVQKSYIINSIYIKSLDATNVTLKHQEISLPIGIQYRKNLYNKFGIDK